MNLSQVAVIGAGTMGRGIAQWFAQQGVTTFLWDNNGEVLQAAMDSVCASWDKLEQKGKFSATQVQSFKASLRGVDFAAIPADCDLALEAVVESLQIKEQVFTRIDRHFSGRTVLASNTSSLSTSQIASCLPPERRGNFLGMHFFNPAPIMKLVEIVVGREKQEQQMALAEELRSWFAERNKRPVVCKDSPGFIVNRIARSFYGEAMRIADGENQGSVEEVDKVLRSVGGFPMGPFELMDLIGIDINYAATCSVWEAFDRHPRFAPHPWQKKLVDSGRLGKKSGGGFY